MADAVLLFARETRSMMEARRSTVDDLATAEMNEHGYGGRASCRIPSARCSHSFKFVCNALAVSFSALSFLIQRSGSWFAPQSQASSPAAPPRTQQSTASTAHCCR